MFGGGGSSTQRSRYRSKRSVQPSPNVPTHIVTNWTRPKIVMVGIATVILATTTFLPILLIEQSVGSDPKNQRFQAPQSLHGIVEKSLELETIYKQKGMSLWNKAKKKLHVQFPGDKIPHETVESGEDEEEEEKDPHVGRPGEEEEEEIPNSDNKSKASSDEVVAKVEKKIDAAATNKKKIKKQQTLARGVAGLPMSQTPALVGAKPGHIDCDVDIDDIVYWNDPQGKRDQEFTSPFATPPEYYLTFEPDPGGWNNIRMSMEIIFVLAAVTGRTLVLPPKAPFYLLGTGKKNARSFGSFFPLDHPEFQKRVKVISMEEFFEKEGKNTLKLSDEEYTKLKPLSEMCLHNKESNEDCIHLYTHLREVGTQPDLEAAQNCFVFDVDAFQGKEKSDSVKKRVERFCGDKRAAVYYNQELHSPKLMHWDASQRKHRLLGHFYTFFYFTDPAIDNYYKRFVRDFLHYKDQIYCAAGKIIHALNEEGPWSSLHIRRGDFQYKKVKFSAAEWYNNTKEVWHDDEILFIATDERDMTFFDDLKKHNQVRFLDDYFDMARLGELDPNYLGMIDTIVASHGRAFAGTWFSTFTGFINRMRGYLGHPMKNSWYSWLERKDEMQVWKYPAGNLYPREWPIGWIGIDGDEVLEHESPPQPGTGTDDDAIVSGGNGDQIKPDAVKPDIKLSDLQTDEHFDGNVLARGIAGRPMSETPALEGGARGHIECDVNVDSLAYWNSPQGQRDRDFTSPFCAQGQEKYITFTVDRGGWNNVRMSMEIIFVIAAATGRTLVLPPKEPLYRLRADKENIFRGFADFFPLHTEEFGKRVNIISMDEFVKREGGPDGQAPVPEEMRLDVAHSARHCDKREKSREFCGHIADYLNVVGHVPDTRAQDHCVIFDKDVYEGGNPSVESAKSIDRFCGDRNRTYWNNELQDHPVLHFRAGDKKWRLLTHFYGFIHFTDPAIDDFYKRFVRDFLHYHDQIYCAAGKIVKALQYEATQRGWSVDSNGGGGYSAMHIRRGDFQYKKVKIPAEEWYENTKEVWKPNELLFIATDERNKTFFDPIAEHHPVRFLDDYMELAGLDGLDPNYFGMIDTIISSRGRAFAGTWFSTFTGYINRMRGYHGFSMKDSWYSFLERKTKMHTWENVDDFAYAYEWPDGWIGIDADTRPSKDIF